MQKSQQVLQTGWSACLAAALFGFFKSPEAVAWLLAAVACLVPLMISLFLNGEVAAVLYDAPDVSAVAGWIRALGAASESGVGEVGVGRQMVEGAARLVAPLL